MNLEKQRDWYETWHQTGASPFAVERLKQATRIESLRHVIGDVTEKDVLLLGCGQGDELLILNGAKITATDLSFSAVNHARRLIESGAFFQADGMQLPLPDERFDIVITSEVIEHILEPSQFLNEIHRILKPNGKVVISTPNWNSFFGLARRIGEAVLQRPITSDDQPVDNWSTKTLLQQQIEAHHFRVDTIRGAWYFAPTGLGTTRLPDEWVAPLFKQLLPLENQLQHDLPGFGHLLIMRATRLGH